MDTGSSLVGSVSVNSHGLPFLPGFTFQDITKSEFHRPQTLEHKHGIPKPCCIRQDAMPSEHLIMPELDKLTFKTPRWSYGAFYKSTPEQFIPAYVALDKKVLRFYAYFQEDVLYSPEEVYRVRPVTIYYYLEDDSLLIYEPTVENSGLPQRKRLRRHRVPKNERGDYYEYTDLNLGMDLVVYRIKYHITDCDEFTKQFMKSEGISLKEPETMPVDPYIKGRKIPVPRHSTPSNFESTLQFLTMDGKVLSFLALWDDYNFLQKETRTVTIHYYLADDTVEIREIHEPNSGRYPFPVLMSRRKLPKKLKPKPFPICVLEVSKDEVEEYYTPRDFRVGYTVKLLCRPLKLYRCDDFTKEYFRIHYPDINMDPIELPKKVEVVIKREIPPYNGFGSREDSLQNCLSLIPKPPRQNVAILQKAKDLSQNAIMDAQNPMT